LLGIHELYLWPDDVANPIGYYYSYFLFFNFCILGTCIGNIGVNAPKLIVSFPSFFYPVRFPKEYTIEEEEKFLEEKRSSNKKSSVLFIFFMIFFFS
jgi:hypothetical protein